MFRYLSAVLTAALVVVVLASPNLASQQQTTKETKTNPHIAFGTHFQTSDRCIACHNGLSTSTGEDISIGYNWRTSMMANAARDPYWQAGVRREIIDHPTAKAAIEDECSICHMPAARYEAKLAGREGEIFSHLPFAKSKPGRSAGGGRRDVFGVPPDHARQLRQTRELRRRLQDRHDAANRRTAGLRSVQDREGPDLHDGLVARRSSRPRARTFATPSCARPATRSSRRRSGRRASQSASSPNKCPIRSGCTATTGRHRAARRATCRRSWKTSRSPPSWASRGPAWRGTRSWAATSSCSGC